MTGLAVVAAAAATVVLAHGHVDYGLRSVDGQPRTQVKDATAGPAVWREVADVRVELDDDARTTVPRGGGLGFLGHPGDPTWLIPQVQQPGVVWLGWNTQELARGSIQDDGVDWRLEDVQGPGHVALFQTGGFGRPDVLFNTRDGLPDTRTVPVGTHAHGSWAFSRPGDYRLRLRWSGTRTGGATFADTQTLAVSVRSGSVIPAPTATATPVPPQAPAPPPGPYAVPTPEAAASPASPDPVVRAPGLRLRAKPRLRGNRRLRVPITIERRSRLRVAVLRRGRVQAAGRSRRVAGGRRVVRVRLSRRLGPGRYRVRVRATAGGVTEQRRRALRVR